jgi:hypothetical protein
MRANYVPTDGSGADIRLITSLKNTLQCGSTLHRLALLAPLRIFVSGMPPQDSIPALSEELAWGLAAFLEA